jgi:hypothetical protein
MKVIGITIDEVLRDFLGHLSYVMAKIREEEEYVVTEDDVTDFDLVKHYKFESKEEMYNLFYKEASLEIFGHPDQLHDNIVGKLNMLYMDMIDEEEDVEFVIMTREVGRAIPATLFFLSKLECEIPNIKFFKNYEEMWEHADVLITANPIVLDAKPEGKTSVKVICSYNTEPDCDFAIESLNDFIEDEELRYMIINKN